MKKTSVIQFQRDLHTDLVAAEKRLLAATKNIEAAKSEYDEANAEFTLLQTRSVKFAEVFGDEIKLATKTPAVKAPKASASTPRATRKRSDGGMSMLDRMRAVMGTQSMTAKGVNDALEAANLKPNSKNPGQYISTMFSSQKDGVRLFEQVSRGVYRVNPTAATKTTKVSAAQDLLNSAVATPASTAAPLSPSDQIFSDVGIAVPLS